jgi:hypothetical protein
MEPRAEVVHWLFATGFVFLGACILAEAVVGPEAWRRRPWRAQLWPGLVFGMGLLLWPVMTFFTNSAIHMVAHGAWAQVMMLAGGAELALERGKLSNPLWRLTSPLALAVSGVAFLVHEQNAWLFSRAAFLHHLIGWTALLGASFPLLRALRPRSATAVGGFAFVLIAVAAMLYADRDTAAIFGHLSPLAGVPHR